MVKRRAAGGAFRFSDCRARSLSHFIEVNLVALSSYHQIRKSAASRTGDIGWGEMGLVPLGDPRVGMADVSTHNAQQHGRLIESV